MIVEMNFQKVKTKSKEYLHIMDTVFLFQEWDTTQWYFKWKYSERKENNKTILKSWTFWGKRKQESILEKINFKME